MSILFGRLSVETLPFWEMLHYPTRQNIVNGAIATAAAFMVLAAGAITALLLTRYRKWGVLWREWLTSVDHKRIGIMYVVIAFVMLARALIEANIMRGQMAVSLGGGFLSADHFEQFFTTHGTIMIFFMAMPFLVGLMNLAVPLQIGARDVAFPFLNSVGLWLTVMSAVLVMVSLGVGDFSHAGWTGYPPLSELKYSPGPGVDYWIWAIQLSGLGTLMTGINFVVTILRMRAPGMTLMRMPVFTWAALCTSALIVLAFPVLTVTLALLTLDRYVGTHFFTAAGGGDLMMYVNLFWVWGHPEVYILVLPAFGIFSEVVATFSSKRLFGYTAMVYATVSITLLSFLVWMHHFFTMGASATVNSAFSIATMVIGVPTGVKLFTWLFTMYRGRLRFTTPMLWTVGFIVTFTIGGMSGVVLAMPPADFVLHNSEFLIAHFHNMLIPGALFGYFAGYAYWFPKAFGFQLNETWGKRAFWAWLVGFYVAFVPLYVLGLMGMPRRMWHYDNPSWQPWLAVAGLGAVLVLIGIVCQIVQLAVSIRDRAKTRDLSGDPWDGRTLEWSIASPPPVYNFARIPVVYDRDAFIDMKQTGTAYVRPDEYFDIHMPRNTGVGFIMGLCAFVFGFAMIWHIWWMAIAGALAIGACIIARAWAEDVDYDIPAAEVARTEAARFRALASAADAERDVVDNFRMRPLPELVD